MAEKREKKDEILNKKAGLRIIIVEGKMEGV